MSKNLKLIEQLESLRCHALSLYETGLAYGVSPKEIQSSLASIQQQLETLMNNAVKENLASCAIAIKRMEHQKNSYQEDITYLMQKKIDIEDHIEHLKQKIIARMKHDNLLELSSGGYSFCLINVNGRDFLIVR